MKYFYIFLLLMVVFLSGCVQVEYVGQTLPARDSGEYVNIYPSMEEVPTEYKVLGRGKIIAPRSYDMDKIDALMTEKALQVGADAVAIASQKRIVVSVDEQIQGASNTPVGSWYVGNTTLDGSDIYTDSFGKQQRLRTTRTQRYRVYYQLVFLTKQNISKKAPAAE